MSWTPDNNESGPSVFGADAEGKTFVFGNLAGSVDRVFIDGASQFAQRDFSSALHRFGNISGIKNSDYQQAVHNIFDKDSNR